MRKVVASILIFVFAFFAFSAAQVSAKAITSENGNVTIAKTEIINDDLFIGAQSVVIDGTVNGDVFIGAQMVSITGTINGNLHVGGNNIDISGKIKGNVYAGAQSILVKGSVIGGSLLAGGATVNIDKDSTIGGSVLAGAGTLSIDSQIKRSVYAGTGNLTLMENTRIGKDLYYSSSKNQTGANISPSAKIAGSVYKSEAYTAKANINAPKLSPKATSGAKVFTTIISFAGALVIYLLYSKLFGNHLAQTKNIISKSFWKSLGVGFLVTIAFVPGLIILLITVIGIPLAGIALLMMLLYSYMAKIVVGSAFGNIIARKFNWKVTAFWAFALGLFVIDIAKLIPVAGFAVGLVILCTGLGALTLRMFSKSD